jgi:hypothetical protein
MKTIMLVCILILARAEVQAQPRLKITPDTLNFGKVGKGYIQGTALLQNSGRDTLKLVNIVTNTGGMIANVMRTLLAPSDTTSLYIKLDANSLGYGRFLKYVSIHTSETPEVRHTVPVIGMLVEPRDLPSVCTRPR